MRIYALLLEWIGFGDFSVAKEGLALHLLRADKLYEYYSLYRILCWLSDRGYTPSSEESRPIRCGNYLPRRKYHPETQIASIFSLCRGKSRLKLYYQPIIHAGLDEEEGISLHRLSSRYSYWTPDYLIEVTSASGQRSFHVIDAKYRPAQDLYDSFSRPSELGTCIMKYMHDVAGKNGKRVSSVWLAAGKQKGKDLYYAETSVWYERNRADFGARSGIFVLNPRVSRLDEVFEEIIPQTADSGEADGALGSFQTRRMIPRGSDGPREKPEPARETPLDKHGKAGGTSRVDLSAIDTRASDEPSVPEALEVSTSRTGEGAASTGGSRERGNADEGEAEANENRRTKQKQVGGHRSPADLDTEVKGSIETIVRHLAQSDCLYDGRWAQRQFGLNRPLVRKSPPIGREAVYYSVLNVEGAAYWVCSRWMPNQKALLARFTSRQFKNATE